MKNEEIIITKNKTIMILFLVIIIEDNIDKKNIFIQK